MPEQTAPTGRPYTPNRTNPDGSRTGVIKRMCSGCGRNLGDVTMQEIQDAIDGKPLSDTSVECGCAGPLQQLTTILTEHINFFDHELGDAPRAILAAGWQPPPHQIPTLEELEAARPRRPKPVSWTRLVENNEHECETWTFWIRTEGNESELARLAQIVEDLGDGDEQFQVLEPVELTDDQVDALVTFGGEGYMRLHTKLSGRLQLPSEAPKTGAYPLGDWFPHFYKGGIRKFVSADREDRNA